MPVTYFNVTDIAHADSRMEDQLLEEVSCPLFPGQDQNNTMKTGRKTVLDKDWTTLPTAAQGFHSFLYDSHIEFILIKTHSEIHFQRILPLNADVGLAGVHWDSRTGEQYYIFKIDPAQKVIVTGTPSVRFFRNKEPLGTSGRLGRPWEAEDVYMQRDVVEGEIFPPEHLAEVKRRFRAWRAMCTESLFVFLMVPGGLNEGESGRLTKSGVCFVEDVPWVL